MLVTMTQEMSLFVDIPLVKLVDHQYCISCHDACTLVFGTGYAACT